MRPDTDYVIYYNDGLDHDAKCGPYVISSVTLNATLDITSNVFLASTGVNITLYHVGGDITVSRYVHHYVRFGL